MLNGECGNMSVNNEHEQVSKTKSFLKYSIDIEGILEYSLTHGI
jgi:hypothetical protein